MAQKSELVGQPVDGSALASTADHAGELEMQVEELEHLRAQLQSELAERERTERRLAIQYSIARTLAEASDLRALAGVLRVLCAESGWDVGALWLEEPGLRRLQCIELWVRPGVRLTEFSSLTRALRFERGVGVPGRVWAECEPLWFAELTSELKLPRFAAATAEGLRSAFGFPIRLEGQTVGVFEFFARRVREPEEDFIHMADAVGNQVGQFIERKAAEAELRSELERRRLADDASRRLAAIVESSDDAIISKDLSGRIMSWNAGAERIFGYRPQEIIGKNVLELIPPRLQHEEPVIVGRIRRGERIDHFETIRRRKDGSEIEISLTVSPIKDEEGVIVGASKIARDITDQKRSERALREAKDELARVNAELEQRVEERTKSLRLAIEQMEEFSYSVSHDLRSPARAMAGYASAVLQDFGDQIGAEGREYLERIVRNASKMDRLIQDLLTYTRLSRREIQLQPVALDRLVHEVLEQYPEMREPRAEVAVAGPLRAVMAHEPSLSQVVSNLLTNAVKFVPPGVKPQVTVSTEARGREVRLLVRDNGIGIPPQYRDRLFGMFERVHPDKKYEGTGIGLAIVRKAAERMGGSAGVESDGRNGSTFWVQLPAANSS